MVVFDAAGTLVRVEGSVGDAYADVARRAGADLDADRLQAGFAAALQAAPPLAFGERPGPERTAAERAWWRAVARGAIEVAGPPPGFDFERFFDLAWMRFAGPEAWRVPDDVRPALRSLRRAGVPLAVFSNWDGRLPPLLDALGLGGFFARVVVSSELPAAKPSPEAYAAAAAALAGVEGDRPPIMVGDRLDHDVEPALAAGWGAVWLDRRGSGEEAPGGAIRIGRLGELLELVVGERVGGAR